LRAQEVNTHEKTALRGLCASINQVAKPGPLFFGDVASIDQGGAQRQGFRAIESCAGAFAGTLIRVK
jgi:hypothetical protein